MRDIKEKLFGAKVTVFFLLLIGSLISGICGCAPLFSIVLALAASAMFVYAVCF